MTTISTSGGGQMREDLVRPTETSKAADAGRTGNSTTSTTRR